MTRIQGLQCLRWLASGTGLLGLMAPSAIAQVTPDQTLGKEASIIERINSKRDRIGGGARRGESLFHSFRDFNINKGKAVYFANPTGIEQILSRVTGDTPSSIFGTLGVEGQADLFFLNPNGILFGPDAKLDIAGSFYASTTDGQGFGEHNPFGAIASETDQLLTIGSDISFFQQALLQPGNIINQGDLAAGNDLALVGGDLELAGSLVAGGNLSLLGLNSVKIRDDFTRPFQAVSGENLLVQGNENVDIFALNHPESALVSGGNMVLRSSHAVNGDAQYLSGGDFRIELLNGNTGDLFSPHDPIIRSLGDVDFNIYFGDSLHIIAAGSVDIGDVNLMGNEVGNSGIDFIQQTVQLSDGSNLQIDGGKQATLDIRAGVLPELIILPEITGINFASNIFIPRLPSLISSPSSADIDINSVVSNSPDSLVFITNQYGPNLNLPGGDINITGDISTTPFLGNSGDVVLDVRGSINLVNQAVNTSSLLENAGNISIFAGDNVLISDGGSLQATSLFGKSGEIKIRSDGVLTVNQTNLLGDLASTANINISASSIEISNSSLSSTINEETNSGRIKIRVDEALNLEKSKINSTVNNLAFSDINSGLDVFFQKDNSSRDSNTMANIDIAAKAINISNSMLSSTATGNANLEKIKIQADERLTLDQSIISSIPVLDGDSDGIEIVAQSVNVTGASVLTATTSTGGDAGPIEIRATKDFALSERSQIRSSTSGLGNGGIVKIIAGGDVRIDGVRGSVPDLRNNSGIFTTNSTPSKNTNRSAERSGGIFIDAKSLFLTNGAQLNSSTNGQGDAGDIKVDVTDSLTLSNGSIFSTAEASARGNGGLVRIDAHSVSLSHGSQITTNTLSSPGTSSDMLPSRAGNISVRANDFIFLAQGSGILSSVGPGGVGKGGDIDLKTNSLSLSNGSQIQAILFRERDGLPGGQGEGGLIKVNAPESVTLSGTSSTGFSGGLLVLSERGAFGSPGSIKVTTGDFQVDNGAVVAAGIFNNGGKKGGDITINANNFKALKGGQILTNTRSSSNAGSIKLNVKDSILIEGRDENFETREDLVRKRIETEKKRNPAFNDRLEDIVINEGANSGLFANTSANSTGDGGDIIIDPITVTLQDGGTIAVDSQGLGKGGDIQLESGFLFLNNLAEIRASSRQTGDAGNITLKINESLEANNSNITTSAQSASGGEIFITAEDIRLSGDSDILTNVETGRNTGGNISLTADSIIAFDDSDIIASSEDGAGGNILLNTPVFFGSRFQPPVQGNPNGNNRVDIDATGAISNGSIQIPDVSFVQNNLSELPETLVNPETLVANSCVIRRAKQTGTFTITGSGGLPDQPGSISSSTYSTAEVRPISDDTDPSTLAPRESWSPGEPIVEPQRAYKLPNGQIALSRECD